MAPDPFDELRALLQPAEAAQLVRLLCLVHQAGGWGEIWLPFKRCRLGRPTVTLSLEDPGREDPPMKR